MRPPHHRPGPHGSRARRCAAAAAALAAAVLPLCAAGPAAAAGSADQSFTIKDPRITESSGLAASRIHPGVYWTHNDSDDGPYVYAVDSRTGETVATVTMRGIGSPRDVEAISLGPDGDLYVGDIGDNLDGTWDHVWIYRFPEPRTLRNETVDATQFTVKYADGPRNAESLMIDPTTGRAYIASKKEEGGGLYQGPARLTASGTNVFHRIADVPWVTDGAFSPDGRQLVLRSYFSARGYAWKNGRPGTEFPVSAPLQPQAESVTYTPDGKALMFGSEGKGSKVQRVDLPHAAGNGAGRGSGDPGSDAGTHSGVSGGATAQGADGSGSGTQKGSAAVGAAVLVALAAVFLGARRFRRRR